MAITALSPRQLAISVIDICRDEQWPLAALVSHLGIEGRRIIRALALDAEAHPKEYSEAEHAWIEENAHEVRGIHALNRGVLDEETEGQMHYPDSAPVDRARP